jgi:hypothetical protein
MSMSTPPLVREKSLSEVTEFLSSTSSAESPCQFQTVQNRTFVLYGATFESHEEREDDMRSHIRIMTKTTTEKRYCRVFSGIVPSLHTLAQTETDPTFSTKITGQPHLWTVHHVTSSRAPTAEQCCICDTKLLEVYTVGLVASAASRRRTLFSSSIAKNHEPMIDGLCWLPRVLPGCCFVSKCTMI